METKKIGNKSLQLNTLVKQAHYYQLGLPNLYFNEIHTCYLEWKFYTRITQY